RQRDFSFLQIAQHWLSKLLRRRRKIQQIVHELERKSCIGSVIRERLFLFSFESAENSAQSRASTEETRRLVRRKFQRVLLRHINAANLRELNQLAFDHFLREINQDIKDAEVALF